ncbi:unnamed protein product [Rotaria sp. Silwood2]|nr:unnamed protein product [Rotaria sp. Silwood2]CAF2933982.1 unnamed protein product [Rotaria sp. Silwood2]CAF3982626.1 unnamed protein product [Rotaria sp. Silwood2]CAF4387589.1 unnamed protein product [Rotaria sp. Silwood2]
MFHDYIVDIRISLHESYLRIYRYWLYFLQTFDTVICIPVTCITTVAYAAQELVDENLPSYDYTLYIYSIVTCGLLLLLYPAYLTCLHFYFTNNKDKSKRLDTATTTSSRSY